MVKFIMFDISLNNEKLLKTSKCGGNIKLLYDYGSNYNFDDVSFDCTTNSYSKPKIYKCNKCKCC